MLNNTMALATDEFIHLNKQTPFPREEERVNGFAWDTDEIGLLDIVLLDAMDGYDAINP